jgi:hypothetical protein
MHCRRHLNIRGKSANLPAITDKDWLDLQFGIDVGVDYYALSFVRSADVIYELKAYLAKQGTFQLHQATLRGSSSTHIKAHLSWFPSCMLVQTQQVPQTVSLSLTTPASSNNLLAQSASKCHITMHFESCSPIQYGHL